LYRAHDLRHRPRGPLDGPYNEWSLVYTPISAPPSERLLDVVLEAASIARNIDLSDVLLRHPERSEISVWPGEHYRLLPALAMAWGARNVVEIGTFRGASALSFLAAPCVHHVTTFDLLDWKSFEPTYLTESEVPGRIDQVLGDVSDPLVFATHRELFSNADLLFVDAPKEGLFEPAFLDLLLESPSCVDQLLVFDDIRVLTMIELWRSLPLDRIDITSFGHWSGTGVAIRASQQIQPDTGTTR
jgi:predicted O-methyltransferase YrrM